MPVNFTAQLLETAPTLQHVLTNLITVLMVLPIVVIVVDFALFLTQAIETARNKRVPIMQVNTDTNPAQTVNNFGQTEPGLGSLEELLSGVKALDNTYGVNGSEPLPSADSLALLTVAQLKVKASELGLSIPKRTKKGDIINALVLVG